MEMIRCTSEGAVARVTLVRADMHNAFNAQMVAELTQVFRKIGESRDIRLVLLDAEGASFSAGADLNWMAEMKQATAEENRADSLRMAEMFETINHLPQPLIAVVQGAALGGGVGLTAVADYVVAFDTAVFGFSEVLIGLVPAVISPYVVAKIGESQARAWFLSGTRFSADHARRIGLVHEVISRKDLDERLPFLRDEFLKAAPYATRKAKELIFNIKGKGLSEVKEYTASLIAELRVGDEGQEGISALMDKRKPRWVEE